MRETFKHFLECLFYFCIVVFLFIVVHYAYVAYDYYKNRVLPDEDAITYLNENNITDETIVNDVAYSYALFKRNWNKDSNYNRCILNLFNDSEAEYDVVELLKTLLENFEGENNFINCCTAYYRIDGELIQSTQTTEDIIVNTDYYINAINGEMGIYILNDTDYIFYAPIFERDTDIVFGVVTFKYYVGNHIEPNK